MTAPLLACRGLTVSYPRAERPALAGLGLEVRAGEKLAVIGESGSGKSTLARAIAGLLPEGSRVTGELRWSGAAPRAGSGIGYVFQDPGGSLNPLLSVGAQLVEVIRTHAGLPRAAARSRATDLLARVRIPEPRAALGAWPHQFSGGQAQRIAIALAIAGGPRLLIADEATSALDVLVQAEIVGLLRELAEEGRLTLLFVTHDIALAGTLADRVLVLDGGRAVETGPAAEVIRRPRDPYTRTLLAAHLDLSSPRLVAAAP